MGAINVDFDKTGQLGFKKAYDLVSREVLHKILLEFCIPITLERQRKICLNETYSRVHGGKHLSHVFPITNGLKRGDTLSPLLSKFA
jgi:hypothetical protein